MNKDLISGFDLTIEDINNIFALTRKLKKKKRSSLLKNKVVGLVFQKPSVRTRVSFEVGIGQLGGRSIYLAPGDMKLGSREPIKDVARVLSRYLELIVARTFSHEHVLQLAKFARVNVINGLSDLFHPCQALADIYTIVEIIGKCRGVKLAFIGDGNNVAHSLLAIGAKMGLNVNIATPKKYEPDKQIWKKAQQIAKKTKAKLVHTYKLQDAIKNADFIYTDVWISMGQEKEKRQRMRAFKNYQINGSLLKNVGKKYYLMHCMPIHRGEEISDKAVESKQSIIFDQAENRLHVQKAIMALLLKSGK